MPKPQHDRKQINDIDNNIYIELLAEIRSLKYSMNEMKKDIVNELKLLREDNREVMNKLVKLFSNERKFMWKAIIVILSIVLALLGAKMTIIP